MWLRKIMSVFFLVIWVVYYILALQLKMGTYQSPKAGFMPQWIGIIAIILTVINVITVFRKDPKWVGPTKEDGKIWINIVSFVALSMAYIYSMSILGYLISSIAYMIVLMRITRVKKWSTNIITAVLVSVGFWLLFQVAMNVTLPMGIFKDMFY